MGVMGVGVVRMRRGGMLWLGLRVGVVGVRSDLIEIHDRKDQGKTNPQGARALFAVRSHILQIMWDFRSSQLFRGIVHFSCVGLLVTARGADQKQKSSGMVGRGQADLDFVNEQPRSICYGRFRLQGGIF